MMASFSRVEGARYPLWTEWYLPDDLSTQQPDLPELPKECLQIGDETYYKLDSWKMRVKFLQLSLTDPILQPLMATLAIVSEVAMGILNGLLSPFSGDPRQLLESARLILHACSIPFALIALEATAILGIVTPHYARHLYTKIEDFIYHQVNVEQWIFYQFTAQAFGPAKKVDEYQQYLEREAANPNGSKGFFHFLGQACKNSNQTASLIPSSRTLALEITSHIDQLQRENGHPLRILEVGAGSGAFTEEVLKKLRPVDHFDVVELEPGFCEILKEIPVGEGEVIVHEKSILDFEADEQYDVIISGLPLHAINSPEFVEQVYAKYNQLAKKDALISQFEYIGLPQIGTLIFCGEQRENHLRILEIKRKMLSEHTIRIAPVYWNFPPAQVLHIKQN